ncbi:hypothetical protein M0802_009492 [Mischocyttarus mexicanus]|nr:hypothetical protein M0802_009492 [Mischocyttarus mexicanus]
MLENMLAMKAECVRELWEESGDEGDNNGGQFEHLYQLAKIRHYANSDTTFSRAQPNIQQCVSVAARGVASSLPAPTAAAAAGADNGKVHGKELETEDRGLKVTEAATREEDRQRERDHQQLRFKQWQQSAFSLLLFELSALSVALGSHRQGRTPCR